MNGLGNDPHQRAMKSTRYKRFGCDPNSGDNSITPVKNTLNNITQYDVHFQAQFKDFVQPADL